MNRYLALFLPAYGVTLIAVPVAMMIDHLGRGATPLRAISVLPLWEFYAALFAIPFALPAAGLALLLQCLFGDSLRGMTGRLFFTLICAGLGAAVVTLTIHSFALIAAASGGTAAWLASSPAWPPRWRSALVITVGLTAGIILGWQYY